MPPQVARSWACALACVALLCCLLCSAPPCSAKKVSLSMRSFFDIQCKGTYDPSIFARVDRICDDCYNLFRKPQLYRQCREDCFTTKFYKACLDVLQQDNEGDFQTWITQLNGVDPGR